MDDLTTQSVHLHLHALFTTQMPAVQKYHALPSKKLAEHLLVGELATPFSLLLTAYSIYKQKKY